MLMVLLMVDESAWLTMSRTCPSAGSRSHTNKRFRSISLRHVVVKCSTPAYIIRSRLLAAHTLSVPAKRNLYLLRLVVDFCTTCCTIIRQIHSVSTQWSLCA